MFFLAVPTDILGDKFPLWYIWLVCRNMQSWDLCNFLVCLHSGGMVLNVVAASHVVCWVAWFNIECKDLKISIDYPRGLLSSFGAGSHTLNTSRHPKLVYFLKPSFGLQDNVMSVHPASDLNKESTENYYHTHICFSAFKYVSQYIWLKGSFAHIFVVCPWC